MAREIKRIQVKDQQQAAVIINQLSQQYELKSDTARHQLHVSNGRYAAFYDAEEGGSQNGGDPSGGDGGGDKGVPDGVSAVLLALFALQNIKT
jgi:hypothetical protein